MACQRLPNSFERFVESKQVPGSAIGFCSFHDCFLDMKPCERHFRNGEFSGFIGFAISGDAEHPTRQVLCEKGSGFLPAHHVSDAMRPSSARVSAGNVAAIAGQRVLLVGGQKLQASRQTQVEENAVSHCSGCRRARKPRTCGKAAS